MVCGGSGRRQNAKGMRPLGHATTAGSGDTRRDIAHRFQSDYRELAIIVTLRGIQRGFVRLGSQTENEHASTKEIIPQDAGESQDGEMETEGLRK